MTLYLCDGDVEECKKNGCYKNGGPCRHTSNVLHAKNFEKDINDLNFFEKDDKGNTHEI